MKYMKNITLQTNNLKLEEAMKIYVINGFTYVKIILNHKVVIMQGFRKEFFNTDNKKDSWEEIKNKDVTEVGTEYNSMYGDVIKFYIEDEKYFDLVMLRENDWYNRNNFKCVYRKNKYGETIISDTRRSEKSC